MIPYGHFTQKVNGDMRVHSGTSRAMFPAKVRNFAASPDKIAQRNLILALFQHSKTLEKQKNK